MNPLLASILGATGALRSAPRLPFEEWAVENIRNPDGSKFQFRPYQLLPASDMFNPLVSSVAIRAYSGAGKTYLFLVAYATLLLNLS